MIKRVEVNYRGIFQKNLGKKIGSDIVMIASRMGQRAFSNGRYSDSPERNGIPCKYFAFVSPDLPEEELEAECGAKLEIDEANISVVLDDTMCKGVEPWGWHGIMPINERVVKDGCLLVVSRKKPEELLKFIGNKPYNYRLAILDGDASLAGLWVNKDDMTHERIWLGIGGGCRVSFFHWSGNSESSPRETRIWTDGYPEPEPRRVSPNSWSKSGLHRLPL